MVSLQALISKGLDTKKQDPKRLKFLPLASCRRKPLPSEERTDRLFKEEQALSNHQIKLRCTEVCARVTKDDKEPSCRGHKSSLVIKCDPTTLQLVNRPKRRRDLQEKDEGRMLITGPGFFCCQQW